MYVYNIYLIFVYTSMIFVYQLEWPELCPLQNSYVETLAPNKTVPGDRDLKEVFKVKWDYMDGS